MNFTTVVPLSWPDFYAFAQARSTCDRSNKRAPCGYTKIRPDKRDSEWVFAFKSNRFAFTNTHVLAFERDTLSRSKWQVGNAESWKHFWDTSFRRYTIESATRKKAILFHQWLQKINYAFSDDGAVRIWPLRKPAGDYAV